MKYSISYGMSVRELTVQCFAVGSKKKEREKGSEVDSSTAAIPNRICAAAEYEYCDVHTKNKNGSSMRYTNTLLLCRIASN